MRNKNRGDAVTAIILALLVLVGLYIYGVKPHMARMEVAELRKQPPPVTAQDRALVEAYRKQETPELQLAGSYETALEVDGQKVSLRWDFHPDNFVTISTGINEYRLSGSARYQFSGSVMEFDKVAGDKIFFSEIGIPIEVPEDGAFAIYSDAEWHVFSQVKNNLAVGDQDEAARGADTQPSPSESWLQEQPNWVRAGLGLPLIAIFIGLIVTAYNRARYRY